MAAFAKCATLIEAVGASSVTRQLSRGVDPGKPSLGSGHLAWLHLAGERAAAASFILCPAAPSQPRFDIHSPSHSTCLPNNACKPSGAHGRTTYCARSHATAKHSRTRNVLVSRRHCAVLQVVAVTAAISRSTGSGDSKAPPKSPTLSLRLQQSCALPGIVLFQLFTCPLLVSCRSGLAVRIRLPARTLRPTTLPQVFPNLR
ncbi:hypothetical protein OPT61_g6741 [Boeremia exigua]|uniref:Uncharacterized protein n=1 Tax=Boeremia exigua TaxID=749465 RepID=A0ACC2I4Y4_9PLEO|nr:hypothetical protein OPT61_g6741 [Boeremia exigua]